MAAKLQKTMVVPACKHRTSGLGARLIGSREMMAYFQAEYDEWRKVIKTASIKADWHCRSPCKPSVIRRFKLGQTPQPHKRAKISR